MADALALKQETLRMRERAGAMRDLASTAAWEVFLHIAHERMQDGFARLRMNGKEEHDRWVGFLEGCEQILSIPKDTIEAATRV